MGGYAAGYYSYIWAGNVWMQMPLKRLRNMESLFDQATATSFRKNILEKGGSDDPMKLYVTFRGQNQSGCVAETRGLEIKCPDSRENL